jgi:transcriptional regulator with XRE-family HTH domain
MARPPKDPNHPLVRLRAILSTPATKRVPANEMSRERFAKKTGIPEPSLKDIETGRYKMTPDVAYKISFATGVDPKSLLRGDDPLLDFTGQPYSKASPKTDDAISSSVELGATNHLLLVYAWEVAKEKKIANLFHYMFDTWLHETFSNLGLQSAYDKEVDRTAGNVEIARACLVLSATAESKRLSATKFKQLAEKKSHSPKKAA